MLIQQVNDIRRHLPSAITFDIKDIKGISDNDGEPNFIIPVIGQELYDHLNEKLAINRNKLTALERQLLEKIYYPLANYCILNFIPTGRVTIGPSGITVSLTAEQRSASKEQIRDLKLQLEGNAWKGIESLIKFLELNANDFAMWTNSDAYSILTENFINTAEEFTKWYNIGGSRRLFMAMKSIMNNVDETAIQKQTGKELYDELKTQIAAPSTLTNLNKTLLKVIRPVVALSTVERAMIELRVKITANGLQLDYVSVDSDAPATPNEEITALLKSVNERKDKAVTDLHDFLYAKASDYPLFGASDAYQAPDTDVSTQQNLSGQGIAMF